MCKYNNCALVKVWIPPELSHTGKGRWDIKPIDACIARIIEALNKDGIRTISSCCGHGNDLGRIDLEDGRALVVIPATDWHRHNIVEEGSGPVKIISATGRHDKND